MAKFSDGQVGIWNRWTSVPGAHLLPPLAQGQAEAEAGRARPRRPAPARRRRHLPGKEEQRKPTTDQILVAFRSGQ